MRYEESSRRAITLVVVISIAAELGKASFALAWVMDEDDSERERGVTMDVATKSFATQNHDFTILDAPGHADFLPSLITGAAAADVGLLVVPAAQGEFEAAWQNSIQQHVVLARGLGISQLVVAVNKLDAVEWSQERFRAIRTKLLPNLQNNGGFNEKRIQFIPVSAWKGINVQDKPPSDCALTKWYKGLTLLQAINAFQPAPRKYGELVHGKDFRTATFLFFSRDVPPSLPLSLKTNHFASL